MKAHYTILRLILGDQLNLNHSWFKKTDEDVLYVMMEVRQETDYVKHHVQKILAFFAAMRDFAAQLKKKGHHLLYLTLDDPQNRQSVPENLEYIFRTFQIKEFEFLYPDEYRLEVQLRDFCSSLSIPTKIFDSEHFLTRRYEVRDFFGEKTHYLMESFYRMMRRRYGILMENDKPFGGAWNYDKENRNAYDGSAPVPEPLLYANDIRDIKKVISSSHVQSIGQHEGDTLLWPINREQSLELCAYFMEHCLPVFGMYQDAMAQEHWSLFHSRLSFSLNTKMLSPREVIDAALNAWQQNPNLISLPQVEGFIRQIIGWREYMRGVYWAKMPDYRKLNFFEHKSSLPKYYWNGETNMNCMRQAIGQSLRYAYAHHIQRLMVAGNFALLAGIHPDEVDAWYLGVYIDAIEWVEMPNTRGMSQFADGGLVATKPYVSSANYIHKMSDYCGDCFYERSKKYGDGACPFNSLYWAFYHRHRARLAKNPRIAMMYRVWDKMAATEQSSIINQAGNYLKNLNAL